MIDIEIIKKLTLSALVADDILIGILVLKGGNALNLAYDITNRGSIDINFSMAGDFTDKEKNRLKNQLESILNNEFCTHGLLVFDVKFEDRPGKIDPKVASFWGGYMLSFKVIEFDKIKTIKDDLDSKRRNALPIGKKNSTVFTVDISKYEYIGSKKNVDIEGSIIQVYSPEMLAIEKLRAICQQNPKYKEVVFHMTARPRPRDFFDIHTLSKHFSLDFTNSENLDLVNTIFEAKKVPIAYISEIRNQKDLHFQAWESVIQTVNPEENILEFDTYFEFVIALFKHIV